MNDEQLEVVDTQEVVPTPVETLDTTIHNLADQVLTENDPDKAKDLIGLFNWNISKKNTSRVLKLNDLYDDVTDQMIYRFKNRADQFSNSDLLDYMKTIQGAIDTSTKNLTQIEEPPTIVQQNNTQVNINLGETFNREARERILAAISATLAQAQVVADVTPEVVNTSEQTEIDIDEVLNDLETIVDETKG